MILDPADPTWDVGNGTAWCWDVLAKEAESCSNQQCFLEASGVPVRPWEVPVSRGRAGTSGFSLMCQGLLGATVGGESVTHLPAQVSGRAPMAICGVLCFLGMSIHPEASRVSVLLYTKAQSSHNFLPSPSLSQLSYGQRD